MFWSSASNSRVQGIPAYVELSNIFIALVSELSHRDTHLACSLGRRLCIVFGGNFQVEYRAKIRAKARVVGHSRAI